MTSLKSRAGNRKHHVFLAPATVTKKRRSQPRQERDTDQTCASCGGRVHVKLDGSLERHAIGGGRVSIAKNRFQCLL